MKQLSKPASVVLCLILLTLAFIFIQSMLPPNASGEESGKIAELLKKILPEGSVRDFFVENVRKIAHFTEYGVLGFEVILFLFLTGAPFSRKRLLLAFGFGLLVGFFDETIQIFSGRGPAILDVWIDFSGYMTFSAILLLILTLVRSRKSA